MRVFVCIHVHPRTCYHQLPGTSPAAFEAAGTNRRHVKTTQEQLIILQRGRFVVAESFLLALAVCKLANASEEVLGLPGVRFWAQLENCQTSKLNTERSGRQDHAADGLGQLLLLSLHGVPDFHTRLTAMPRQEIHPRLEIPSGMHLYQSELK